MKSISKVLVIALVLAMIGSLFAGCGGGGGSEATFIVLGELNDLTGPGSPAMLSLHYAIQDLVSYYNENNLIPGVTLKLEVYDTQSDAARKTIGFDFLRTKGATAIFTIDPSDAVMLKAAAERAQIPIFSMAALKNSVEPPGWAFCAAPLGESSFSGALKWIAEKHWDYDKGVPTIGYAGWDEAHEVAQAQTVREYVQAHPDQFQWVASFNVPVGTQTFLGEAAALKDCDYVCLNGAPAPSIMRDITAKGGHPVYVDGTGSLPSMQNYTVGVAGWDSLDGTLVSMSGLDMSDTQYPVIDLAKQLLQEYRQGTTVSSVYASALVLSRPGFEIIGNVVEKMGAKNVTGQAIYETAQEYSIDTGKTWWQGFPQWGLSPVKRYLADDIKIYQFSAADKGLVPISDWVHLET